MLFTVALGARSLGLGALGPRMVPEALKADRLDSLARRIVVLIFAAAGASTTFGAMTDRSTS
jgi:hypothetical protein